MTLGKTTLIEKTPTATNTAPSGPIGEAASDTETEITLESNGRRLTFAISSMVVAGRSSRIAGDPQPDISLNVFDAENQGVSRQHVKFIRKHDLIYVADLGSSNGTFLNGRALLRNSLRMLRSGDELQLGMLNLRVGF